MKTINLLSTLLKFFGWSSIVVGLVFFLPAVFSQTVSLLLGLSTIQRIIGGLVCLSLATGLSKREKWAFYVGFVILILFVLQSIAKIIFVEFSFILFVTICVDIVLLLLLIRGKQVFVKQEKEMTSQWFRKPHFLVVVVGTITSYIISIVAFILLEGVTILQLL